MIHIVYDASKPILGDSKYGARRPPLQHLNDQRVGTRKVGNGDKNDRVRISKIVDDKPGKGTGVPLQVRKTDKGHVPMSEVKKFIFLVWDRICKEGG